MSWYVLVTQSSPSPSARISAPRAAMPGTCARATTTQRNAWASNVSTDIDECSGSRNALRAHEACPVSTLHPTAPSRGLRHIDNVLTSVTSPVMAERMNSANLSSLTLLRLGSYPTFKDGGVPWGHGSVGNFVRHRTCSTPLAVMNTSLGTLSARDMGQDATYVRVATAQDNLTYMVPRVGPNQSEDNTANPFDRGRAESARAASGA